MKTFDQSAKAKHAIKEIERITKKPFKQADVRNAQGGINYTSKKASETRDHIAIANDMIKIINTTPRLPQMCRKVMCYRILNPGITDMGVALSTGLRVDVVRQYEKEGKAIVGEYMRKIDLTDAHGKFDVDASIQNELRNMNKQGKNNALAYDTK